MTNVNVRDGPTTICLPGHDFSQFSGLKNDIKPYPEQESPALGSFGKCLDEDIPSDSSSLAFLKSDIGTFDLSSIKFVAFNRSTSAHTSYIVLKLSLFSLSQYMDAAIIDKTRL
jgi:hypothetical protein